MANVNSISTGSSSYTSSIYGNRNVLSGLASGMDTESMIENSVSGYQTKITQLQQQQTKLEWKQDAYRSITDKMVALSQKYTSYTSKTNLASNSFFTNAVTTTTSGANASKVSASGKTTSDIKINSVTRLAAAARYTVASSALNFNEAVNLTGGAIDVSGTQSVSTITGSLSITLGTSKYTLDFGADDVYEDAQALVDGINEKLRDQEIDVEATLDESGKITLKSTTSNGDSVYISGASGDFKSVLGVQSASSSAATNRFTFNSISVGDKTLSKELSMADYLSDKTIDVTLNGVTKSVSVGKLDTESDVSIAEQISANLQSNLNKAFGAGAVSVSADSEGKLTFDVKENSGSTLLVSSDVEELGIGTGLSNYFNTGKTLGALLGEDYFKISGTGEITTDANGHRVDATGARVDADGYLVDENGDTIYDDEKDLVINGVSVGTFSRDTALESVMTAINNNAEAGVSLSYSKLTGEFMFTARDTGSGSSIEFGDGLASRLFEAQPQTLNDVFGEDWNDVKIELGNGSVITLQNQDGESNIGSLLNSFVNFPDDAKISVTGGDGAERSFTLAQMKSFADGTGRLAAADSAGFTDGTDAEVNVTVNGKDLTLTRSGNVIDMDGLSVTLKGTFETGADEEAVTFKTSSNADTIVDGVKSFVEDLNNIIKEVHGAYATQPLTNSSGSKYEPLTEDDMDGMSESKIASYEEKAKTGILYMDSDLSALYNKLRSVVTSSGSDKSAMSAIGLTTSYSDGVTTLSLDEDKLRAALDSDPDAVRNVFAKTKEGGSATNGLMANLKSTLDSYASTSIASPGILVRKAGTKLSSLSLINNSVQTQIDSLNDQIDKWQTKLSDKIDYYTKQFTALEQLMSTMNNQSSMLATMMGY